MTPSVRPDPTQVRAARLLHAWRPPAAVLKVDCHGMIVSASDEVEVVIGWRPDDLVGEKLTRLIPERFVAAHEAGFEQFVQTGELSLAGESLKLPALRPDGAETDIELVLSLSPSDEPGIASGVVRSCDPRQASSASELVASLERALASDLALPDILRDCLELMGERLGWRLGTLWIVDPWLDKLRALATWEAEPGANPDYAPSRRESLLARGESIPGQVWDTGAPAWTDDATVEIAIEHVAAGLFFPLVAGSTTVGVVELVDAAAPGFTIETQEAVWLVADELGRVLAERMQSDVDDAERQRLQLALSARDMGVWTYRHSTGEIFWDEQVERIHGLEPGTFSGRLEEYERCVHPDDRVGLLESIVRATEQRERFQHRYRVATSATGETWVEGRGVPLTDLDGAVRELTGVSYDVTGEVRDRQELEERARYAALAADVGRAFVSDGPLDSRLGRCAEAIVDHLDAAFARVWTLDATEDALVLRASAGMYTHLDGPHSRVPVGTLKIGRIAAELEPHLTNQVVGDPQVSDQEWAREEGMVCFAGYPLVVADRCVGVLALFARRALPDSTLSALAAISDTVAIGIEQARAAAEVHDLLVQERRQSETLARALEDRARVAEVLQESLLPPSLPEVTGFDVAARYRAGIEEVGGDFYDLLPLPNATWSIIVGDICGRGPEAARLTALARHSLRMAVMLERSPADALAALNRVLLRSANDNRFCTAVCGVLTATEPTAHVDIGVAGHPPAMIVRRDGTVDEVAPTGPLLGVFADATFDQRRISIGPGELLVVYTDGVVEARRGVELFGTERLRTLLSSMAAQPARLVVDAVLDAVHEFDRAETLDDLALLAMRRDPEA